MEEARLQEVLKGFESRLKWKRTVEAMARWAVYGSLLSMMAVGLLKVAAVEMPVLLWGGLPLIVAPLAAALWVSSRRIPATRVAELLDREQGLAERLGTALEWTVQKRPQTLMSRAQLHDAVARLLLLSPCQAFPVRLRRGWWRAPGGAIPVVALLCVLPPWHLFGFGSDRLDPALLRKEAEQIQVVAEELARPRPASVLTEPERQKLARDLKALAGELRVPGQTRREAMARLSRAREAVRDAHRMAAHRRESLRSGPHTGGATSANQPSEDAARSSLASRLRAAAAVTRKSPLSAADREKMAQALQRLGREAGQPEALRKMMQEAARKLQAGESGEEAARTLEQAARALDEAERESRADMGALEEGLRQMEEASGQLSEGEAMAGGPPEAGSSERGQGAPGDELLGNGSVPEARDGGGKAAPDFGTGSTSREAAPQPVSGKRDYFSKRQSDARSRWSEQYRKLYAPRRRDVRQAATQVGARSQQKGGLLGTGQETRGAGRAGDSSTIDEAGVYQDYRRSAEEAVARGTIPQEYRDLVRNYFEDIDPRGASSAHDRRPGQ